MKLTKLGDNAHVLHLSNGVEILFSYETPVAVSLPCSVNGHVGVIKTNQKFSKTTSAHINAWTATTKTLPHEEFLALVNAAISSR